MIGLRSKVVLPGLDEAINTIVACARFPNENPFQEVPNSCMDCFGYFNSIVELLRSGKKKVTKKFERMISSLEHLIIGYEKCSLTDQQSCVIMGHLNAFVVVLRGLLQLKFSQRLNNIKKYYHMNFVLLSEAGYFSKITADVEKLLQEMERFTRDPWVIWGKEIAETLPIDDTREFLGILKKLS